MWFTLNYLSLFDIIHYMIYIKHYLSLLDVNHSITNLQVMIALEKNIS